jgi:hypothetical protein
MGWFCGKAGPCHWPHCEPLAPPTPINVDDPESFKESILNTVEWTLDTMRQEFRRVMNETLVFEDAGVIVPHFVQVVAIKSTLVVWTELPVTWLAVPVYKPRIDAAVAILKKKFHVEQTQVDGDRDEITNYRVTIRYEYARPV